MKAAVAGEITDALLGRDGGRGVGSVFLFGRTANRCKKFLHFRNRCLSPSGSGKVARNAHQERLLETEAAALKQLGRSRERHVPELLYFGRLNGRLALVTEYCEGYSIGELLLRGHYGSRSQCVIPRAFEQACRCLRALHACPEMQGMHGDMCFSNLIESEEGWRICDWEMWEPECPPLWDAFLLCVDAAKECLELRRPVRRGAKEVLKVFGEEWFARLCSGALEAASAHGVPDPAARTEAWFGFLDHVVLREGRLGGAEGAVAFWTGLRTEARGDPVSCAGMLGASAEVLERASQTGKTREDVLRDEPSL